MSTYIDGYVLPLPKDKIETYRAIATQAAALWKEHGALAYTEAIGEDLEAKDMVTFPQLTNATADDTVVFAWIVFESRAHRDAVNARVMADPRIHAMCDPENPPFDCRRMAYGGFQSIVEA